MEFIRDIFVKLNDLIEPFLGPIIDKIAQFFGSGEYSVITLLMFFGVIIFLIGIIRWVKKTPKFFVTLLVLVAIVVILWILSR